MESTKATAIASTLSPHAQPFVPRSSPSFAVADSSVSSSSVFTCYSSPIQPQVSNANFENFYDYGYNGSTTYCFSNVWAPTPVSATPHSYSSPNTKPAFSPCSTLKKLEIAPFACDPASKLSSDDIDLIDSPCYKGRKSQFVPYHIGETSASPRVTVEKLGEEQNLSVAVTPIAPLMVSDENVKHLSVLVPVESRDSELNVGSLRDNPIKQILDPGIHAGSSRTEMLLQELVDWSDMLLQKPSNAADLAEGTDIRVKMIIEDLEKLLGKAKMGYLSRLSRAYRLDKEKGNAHAYSASSSQKRYCGDDEEHIEANLYKSLWINAEIEKCELKYKLHHAHNASHGG